MPMHLQHSTCQGWTTAARWQRSCCSSGLGQRTSQQKELQYRLLLLLLQQGQVWLQGQRQLCQQSIMRRQQ
jgi:hypothetical protein